MARSAVEYAVREQGIASCAAVISGNGWRVDLDKAQARVDELAKRRSEIMAGLVEKYDFPTEGKAPWSSKPGKAAIFAALEDQGITPDTRPDWPRTAASESAPEGNPSLGGEALLALTKGSPAEGLGIALAELKGQRSLAQLAIDSCHQDGFAHPSITMLQRSGRWSTTEPGLTIWTARGPGAAEKEYFLPDNDREVLLEIDYSNADARGVAVMSGDKKYAERFEPGQDGHLINAHITWGSEVVGWDKDNDPVTAYYRQQAKILGHGWSYGGGHKTLAAQTGASLEDAKRFCDSMAFAFRQLVNWQNNERAFARAHGFVLSDWGRRMVVEPNRIYTQAPALKGQNLTREVVCDALLRMPFKVLRRVKAQIHDALVFSVPADKFTQWRDYLTELMYAEHDSGAGLTMAFPASAGPPGTNWRTAGH